MSALPTPPRTPGAAAVGLRVGVLALGLGSAVFVLAGFFVLAGGSDPATPRTRLVAAGVAVVAAALLHVVLDLLGYRAAPLPADAPPPVNHASALRTFTSRAWVRIAGAWLLMPISLAAAFLVPADGFVVVMTGFVLTLVLLGVHGWPWRRPVRRTAAALEAGGARSWLPETYGYAPWPGDQAVGASR